MKFMKLGSKPDLFQSDGSNLRYVASELPTDVIVNVGEVKFYLHKFPLLSKSNWMQKIVFKTDEGSSSDEVHINDFPGGSKAFEICAKFCYGMIVTLNAYNVVVARCAAEYLEMSEYVEKGNLIYKIEVFLNSSIFRSWKDSIIVLQTTKSLLPWSEELKLTGSCIDSIASKTSVDPSNVNWSYTYNKKFASSDQIVEHAVRQQQKMAPSVPKDWWIEDICELDIDLYKRVMVAIKSKGRMSGDVIGEALKAYALRWLPNAVETLTSDEYARRNRILVETIIWLLPSDKGTGCSCGFLLKLLKVVILVGAGDALREELVNRIGSQLDEASVNDLLIPARPPDNTVYDVGLVQSLVDRFIMQDQGSTDLDYVGRDEKDIEDFKRQRSLLSVGKLIDSYLTEVARDANLSTSSFIDLSRMIPESVRPIHDGLYRAIDMYLKEHPDLTKVDKKKLCSLMDVKKLSPEACMHAAQNDRLPLRVVVQVLFFEQVRAAAGRGLSAPPNNISHDGSTTTNTNTEEEDWERTTADQDDHKLLKKQLQQTKIDEDDRSSQRSGAEKTVKKKKKKSGSNDGSGILLPSRSRRIFDRIWVGKAQQGENKSSETTTTSGSSRSPTSVNPVETKSSGSSSRNRRHSVS
ncbi:BTB/POZ domain-containing protein NPY1 [Acorus gramineus]|uniref:BTB/POZ domain-containing protein NPY1 n=1 Tax=Acorus gramineus TaxID=55184 RepID=A0AAV9AX25_ACOGR|nr:BTB/POZ domain-containing protein NPY1 [Acorus gramineus]